MQFVQYYIVKYCLQNTAFELSVVLCFQSTPILSVSSLGFFYACIQSFFNVTF